MEFLASYKVLAVAVLLLVIVELRNKARAHMERRRIDNLRINRRDIEVEDLRRQAIELKARAHAQLAYFVSYSEAIRGITSAVTIDEVTSGCHRALAKLLETQTTATFLVDECGHFRLFDGCGFPTSLRRQFTFPSGEADKALAELLGSGCVVSLADHPRAREYLRPVGTSWTLVAPIWNEHRVLGMILVANPIGDDLLVHRVLAMIADLTGVALLAARKVNRMQREMRLVLTGEMMRKSLAPLRRRGALPRVPIVRAASWLPVAARDETPS